MLRSTRAPWFSLFVVLLGCGDGSPGSSSQGAIGSAGTSASAGGTAGKASAGTSGGSASGGAAGSGIGSGGAVSFGSAGAASSAAGASAGRSGIGLGGNSATGGATTGSGGTGAGAGTSSSAGAGGRGPAPTFTKIYETIITQNCGGAMCHLKRPTPFGYDFSSKSAASTSWRGDVIANDAENSPMFQVLNLAIMPKDKPPLSVDQLFMIYDWINAGALDN